MIPGHPRYAGSFRTDARRGIKIVTGCDYPGLGGAICGERYEFVEWFVSRLMSLAHADYSLAIGSDARIGITKRCRVRRNWRNGLRLRISSLTVHPLVGKIR